MSGAEPPGERLTLRTPAKINLGLRLVGRRPDGYHLLESVFAPVTLHDELELAWRPGEDRIELALSPARDAGLPKALSEVTAGSDNLVVRAAEAFRGVCPRSGTLQIQLVKRIPAGAGLGGGSSDAGAVLAALARSAGAAAPAAGALAAIALGLGADVPYFLDPRPARVSGIGEVIEPLKSFPALPIVLANPGISVATAEVYRVAAGLQTSLTDPGVGSTMRAISELCGETDAWPPALGELLGNDLEPAAIRLCPPVGRLLAELREAGALGAAMSGSGGTVFGVFASMAEARAAEARLRDRTSSGRIDRADAPRSSGAAWTHVCSTVAAGPNARLAEADPLTSGAGTADEQRPGR